ncbi:MAG: hypothetical protein OEL55_04165 [Desulfobulbaceae bacterium]|nr:hypothetical protein [Desulfobulbaceae bacterium]
MKRINEQQGQGKGWSRVSGPYRFLIIMLVVYAVIGFLNPELAMSALRGFREMLLRVVPILGVVFVFLLCINMVGPERIKKRLGKDSGWKGWMFAAVAGIFIAGPPYMLYPMLGELRKQGVRDAFLGVILYNRNVKIPFVPVMIYYFGLQYTVILSSYILLFAFLNGKILEKLLSWRR